jgi:hypothetical protein
MKIQTLRSNLNMSAGESSASYSRLMGSDLKREVSNVSRVLLLATTYRPLVNGVDKIRAARRPY